MPNRLTKIYTKTGDDGSTGLGDGTRVAKDDLRVEAYGTVDELNSSVGLLMTEELPSNVRITLEQIQHDLFNLGGELCIPNHSILTDKDIEYLEKELDKLNNYLTPLKEFILPGGTRTGALTHLARTICRRAERRVFTLSQEDSIQPQALQYLNRLSDYLFVLARFLVKQEGGQEVLWQNKK